MTLAAVLILNLAAFAQTNEFTYQGQLQSSSAPANGSFDFEFVLFDAGGSQVGPVVPRNGVAVANGIFSVNLDFGSSFPGGTRFLEIRVRQAGGGAFTTLLPSQPVTSSPYSIKSLSTDNATNATELGGVPASQYLQTNGNGSGLTNLNASSITTGTLANARLGQIPTANIADGAVTAPKIASDQVVKTLNGLTDSVTLAGTGNITVTPSGNTLTISTTSGGVGGSGNTGTIPVWNNPTTLGSSLITQTSGAVQLPNTVQLAPGGQGSNITLGMPNNETGVTIGGANFRSDIRFDGSVLRILTGPAGSPPSANSGISIGGGGRVGIGGIPGVSKFGVYADASSPIAMDVQGISTGVSSSGSFRGVSGFSSTGEGVSGTAASGTGVAGNSGSGIGVQGTSAGGDGVRGESTNGHGVNGLSAGYIGVRGVSSSGIGVNAACGASGCTAISASGTSWFQGNTTPLSVANVGSGTGIAIGSEPTAGYIYAFDYGPFQPRNLFINGTGGRVHIGTAFTGSPDQTLSVNGNASKVGGGSWAVLSDERLKNINGRFTGGLKAVMKLQPLRYIYKPDNEMKVVSDGEHIGFSAQAVEKLIPEAVTKNDKGYRMVNNDPIMWTMLNAIKEQQGMIEKLTRQVRQLQRANRKKAESRR